MSTDDAYDDDALAAEYVLHLLDGAEKEAFEARLADDRDLLKLVRDWEARLAPLAADLGDIEPPEAVRRRLMGAIGAEPATSRTFPIWTWIAGAAVSACVFLLVLFGGFFGSSTDLTPAFQAELASEDGSVILVAGVIPATHEIVIERIAGAPPEGFVHELWLIAEGTDVPLSLGLLESDGTTRIRVPDEIAPGVRTGTVAISEEPPGGSSTGAPTGRIVATAQFSDV